MLVSSVGLPLLLPLITLIVESICCLHKCYIKADDSWYKYLGAMCDQYDVAEMSLDVHCSQLMLRQLWQVVTSQFQ